MGSYINEKYDIIVHDTLNPRIWDEDDDLRPEIKDGILEIVSEFKNYIDFDLPIIDVVIVGSNASYNYTPNSDLDIHLIVNFDNIDENKELVNALCQSWKSLFNNAYDITLGGQPAELYVEDMQTSTNSNGIYSVINDRWLKFPDPINVPDFDIDEDLDRVRVAVEDALNSNDYDEVSKMIDWLYYQRKLALQIGDGEFSVGNLIFKAIRNEGLLDKLKEEKLRLRSEQLTVEGLENNDF